MLTILKKHWLFIILALLATLFTCLLYFPHLAKEASGLVLVVSVGFMLAIAIQKPIQAHRAGQLDRSSMWRRLVLDVAGIALTLVLAIPSGRWAAGLVSAWAQAAGWNALRVTLSALLSALAVGFVTGWAVQWLWSKTVLRFTQRSK